MATIITTYYYAYIENCERTKTEIEESLSGAKGHWYGYSGTSGALNAPCANFNFELEEDALLAKMTFPELIVRPSQVNQHHPSAFAHVNWGTYFLFRDDV